MAGGERLEAVKSVSIVMATYNRSRLLSEVLASIKAQGQLRPTQIIVVDDGSDTAEASANAFLCEQYDAEYSWLNRPGYCNPAAARNVGYKAATGDIVIAQSSDVTHDPMAIERLCQLARGTFNIATVWATDPQGVPTQQLTGPECRRPLFFLGSLFREDLYAIGGDDEDFDVLGCEDDWFADRLIHGRGLEPVYRSDVSGRHQWHRRPRESWDDQFPRAQAILARKREHAEKTGEWVAAGGPWEI